MQAAESRAQCGLACYLTVKKHLVPMAFKRYLQFVHHVCDQESYFAVSHAVVKFGTRPPS